MTLLQMHHHFEQNGIELFGLTQDYDHCVYFNRVTGKKFTLLKKEDGDLKKEVILIACDHFRIPIPMEIEMYIPSEEEE